MARRTVEEAIQEAISLTSWQEAARRRPRDLGPPDRDTPIDMIGPRQCLKTAGAEAKGPLALALSGGLPTEARLAEEGKR